MRAHRWISRSCLIALLCCAAIIHGCPVAPPGQLTPEQVATQTEMESLIAWLDSDAYGRSVWWGEHVVLSYRLAQGRDPSLAEFAIINMLREHPGLKRSEVLGLALATEDDAISWEKCSTFLSRNKTDSFKSDDNIRLMARALAARPPSEVVDALADDDAGLEENVPAPKGTETPNESYEAFFGFLHAHSHFSLDAVQSGTLEEAYTMARDEGGLDFMGITDHAEFLILWPWDKKWKRTLAVADAFNEPGRFVALGGFEWSNPLLGHMSVLNTEDFTHTLKTFRVKAMFDWIVARPEAFAQFNHPGDYDFLGLEFRHFKPYPRVAAQMVGIETWNTNYGLDDYFYQGSWNSNTSFLDLANQNGWRIGALGAQDNHRRDWGVLNDFRTGVLATALTREAIIEAFRARRFYATEDSDLVLDFRCDGFPMGATVAGASRQFTVGAEDRGGDTFSQVRLYRNGVEVDSKIVSGSTFSVTLSEPDPNRSGDDYYYVIVTQTDDNDNNGRKDEALSSSIWVTN